MKDHTELSLQHDAGPKTMALTIFPFPPEDCGKCKPADFQLRLLLKCFDPAAPATTDEFPFLIAKRLKGLGGNPPKANDEFPCFIRDSSLQPVSACHLPGEAWSEETTSSIRLFGTPYEICGSRPRLRVHARVKIIHIEHDDDTIRVWLQLLQGSAEIGPAGINGPMRLPDLDRYRLWNLQHGDVLNALIFGPEVFQLDVVSNQECRRLQYLPEPSVPGTLFWDLVDCDCLRHDGLTPIVPAQLIAEQMRQLQSALNGLNANSAPNPDLQLSILKSEAAAVDHVYYRTSPALAGYVTTEILVPAIQLQFVTQGTELGDLHVTRWSPGSLLIPQDSSYQFVDSGPFSHQSPDPAAQYFQFTWQGANFDTEIVSFPILAPLLATSSASANRDGAFWQFAATKLDNGDLHTDLQETGGSWIRYDLEPTLDPDSASPVLAEPETPALSRVFTFASPDAASRPLSGWMLQFSPRVGNVTTTDAACLTVEINISEHIRRANHALEYKVDRVSWKANRARTELLARSPEIYAYAGDLNDPTGMPAVTDPLANIMHHRMFFRNLTETSASKVCLKWSTKFGLNTGDNTNAATLFRSFGRDIVQPVSLAGGNLADAGPPAERAGKMLVDPTRGYAVVSLDNDLDILFPGANYPLGKVTATSYTPVAGRAAVASFPWMEILWSNPDVPAPAVGHNIARTLFHRSLLLESQEFKIAPMQQIGRVPNPLQDEVRRNTRDEMLVAADLGASDDVPLDLENWLPTAQMDGGMPKIFFREQDPAESHRPRAVAKHPAAPDRYLQVQYNPQKPADFLQYDIDWYDDHGTAPKLRLRGDFLCELAASAPQSIPPATATSVVFDITTHDTDGFFDGNVPTHLVVPPGAQGEYVVTATVIWQGGASDTSSRRRLTLEYGPAGSPHPIESEMYQGSLDLQQSVQDVVWLNAGDNIEVKVYHESTSAKNINAADRRFLVCRRVATAANSSVPLLLKYGQRNNQYSVTEFFDNVGVRRPTELTSAVRNLNPRCYWEDITMPYASGRTAVRSLSFEGAFALGGGGHNVHLLCQDLKLMETDDTDSGLTWYAPVGNDYGALGDLGVYRLRRSTWEFCAEFHAVAEFDAASLTTTVEHDAMNRAYRRVSGKLLRDGITTDQSYRYSAPDVWSRSAARRHAETKAQGSFVGIRNPAEAWPLICGVPVAPTRLINIGIDADQNVAAIRFEGVIANPRDAALVDATEIPAAVVRALNHGDVVTFIVNVDGVEIESGGTVNWIFSSEAEESANDGLVELIGNVTLDGMNVLRIDQIEAKASLFGEIWPVEPLAPLISMSSSPFFGFISDPHAVNPKGILSLTSDPSVAPLYSVRAALVHSNPAVSTAPTLDAILTASLDSGRTILKVLLEFDGSLQAQRHPSEDIYHNFVFLDTAPVAGCVVIWVAGWNSADGDAVPVLNWCRIMEDKAVAAYSATLVGSPILTGTRASMSIDSYFGESETTESRTFQSWYLNSGKWEFLGVEREVTVFVSSQELSPLSDEQPVVAQLIVRRTVTVADGSRQTREFQGQVTLNAITSNIDVELGFPTTIYDCQLVEIAGNGDDLGAEDVQLRRPAHIHRHGRSHDALPNAIDVRRAIPYSSDADNVVLPAFVQISSWDQRDDSDVALTPGDYVIDIAADNQQILVGARGSKALFRWIRQHGVFSPESTPQQHPAPDFADASFALDGSILSCWTNPNHVTRWQGGTFTEVGGMPAIPVFDRLSTSMVPQAHSSVNCYFASSSMPYNRWLFNIDTGNQATEQARAITAFPVDQLLRVTYMQDGGVTPKEGVLYIEHSAPFPVHFAIFGGGKDKLPVQDYAVTAASLPSGNVPLVAVAWQSSTPTYETSIYASIFQVQGGQSVPSLRLLTTVSHVDPITSLSLASLNGLAWLSVTHGPNLNTEVFTIGFDQHGTPIVESMEAPPANAACLSGVEEAGPGQSELLLVCALRKATNTRVQVYSLDIGCQRVPDSDLPVDRCAEATLTHPAEWTLPTTPQLLHVQGEGSLLSTLPGTKLKPVEPWRPFPMRPFPFHAPRGVSMTSWLLSPLLQGAGNVQGPICIFRNGLWLNPLTLSPTDLQSDALLAVSRVRPFAGLLHDQTTLAIDSHDPDALADLERRLLLTAQAAGWYGPTVRRTVVASNAVQYSFLESRAAIQRSLHAARASGGIGAVVAAPGPVHTLDPRIIRMEEAELLRLTPLSSGTLSLPDRYAPVAETAVESGLLPAGIGANQILRSVGLERQADASADLSRSPCLQVGTATAYAGGPRVWQPMATANSFPVHSNAFLPQRLRFLFGVAKPGAMLFHRFQNAATVAGLGQDVAAIEIQPARTFALRDHQQFIVSSPFTIALSATRKSATFQNKPVSGLCTIASTWIESSGKLAIEGGDAQQLWPADTELIVRQNGVFYMGRIDPSQQAPVNMRIMATVVELGDQVVESPRYVKNDEDTLMSPMADLPVQLASSDIGKSPWPRLHFVTRQPNLTDDFIPNDVLPDGSIGAPTEVTFSPRIVITSRDNQIHDFALGLFVELDTTAVLNGQSYYVYKLKDLKDKDVPDLWTTAATISLVWQPDSSHQSVPPLSPWSFDAKGVPRPIPVRQILDTARASVSLSLLRRATQLNQLDLADTILFADVAQSSKANPSLSQSTNDQPIILSLDHTTNASVVVQGDIADDRSWYVRLVRTLSGSQTIGAEIEVQDPISGGHAEDLVMGSRVEHRGALRADHLQRDQQL